MNIEAILLTIPNIAGSSTYGGYRQQFLIGFLVWEMNQQLDPVSGLPVGKVNSPVFTFQMRYDPGVRGIWKAMIAKQTLGTGSPIVINYMVQVDTKDVAYIVLTLKNCNVGSFKPITNLAEGPATQFTIQAESVKYQMAQISNRGIITDYITTSWSATG
jgi:hypothetical protein